MNTSRLNITLPVDIVKKLNQERNKSAFIAEAIREKMERDERDRLKKELADAYRASAEEDRTVNAEWDSVSGDGA